MKEKTFLKLHSKTEVGDHKLSGKRYSSIGSIESVNSDDMGKQDNFFNTPCFSVTIFGCSSRKYCQNLLPRYGKIYYQEDPKKVVTQQTSI